MQLYSSYAGNQITCGPTIPVRCSNHLSPEQSGKVDYERERLAENRKKINFIAGEQP